MNNAKEKAKELIEKFYSKYNNVRKDKKYSKEQIRMALICVDEIIEELEYMEIYSRIEYWQKVREEIKNYESTN
jgi:hypothetical protein